MRLCSCMAGRYTFSMGVDARILRAGWELPSCGLRRLSVGLLLKGLQSARDSVVWLSSAACGLAHREMSCKASHEASRGW